MKAMKILLGVLLIFGAVGLFGGCYAFNGYNRAIKLDENVKAKWGQVENQLTRRFELIPNLMETVKGMAGQEKAIFLGVAKARESYFQAKGVANKAKAAGAVESALSRLMFLKETYPELRSNESFLKLQDSLEGTENRLSVERKNYNESVRALNTFVRAFPGRFFASLAGVEGAEYFKAPEEAKTVPKVDFSTGG